MIDWHNDNKCEYMNWHHLIYLENGELWGFGRNHCGQLNLFKEKFDNNIPNPKLIGIDLEIKQIACGESETLILKNNGELWISGYDAGHPKVSMLLMKDINIKKIICGSNQSIILKNNGDIFVLGRNEYKYLNGEYISHPTFLMNCPDIKQIAIGLNHTVILKNNNSLSIFGKDTLKYNFHLMKIINDVICGRDHIFVMDDNNNLYVSGTNDFNQLGDGNYTECYASQLFDNFDAKKICSGADHTMILKNNGELYGFGYNDKMQLGLHHDALVHGAILVSEHVDGVTCGFNSTVILKNNEIYVAGDMLGCGKIYTHRLLKTFNDSKVIGMNNRFGNIKWKLEYNDYISKETKDLIFMFLLVCRYYDVKYKVKMVKYMKFEVIKYLFYCV